MAEKVLVAMSGGVDSSAAVILLMEQGYKVIGATFDNGFGEDCLEAAQLAKELGIEHHIIDVRNQFENLVISPFVEAYIQGKTPNPCVLCNLHLKFPIFLPLMEKLNADYLATGHYVRIKKENDRYVLWKAEYKDKDQSYFLYSLPQHILARCIFPLGDYTKDQIRSKAIDAGLSSANKKDSQDICFIKNDDYRCFISERATEKLIPGNIKDKQGNIVGRHKGLAFYTVGQRRGLELALGYPAYVIALDTTENCLIIGKNEDLFAKTIVVNNSIFQPFQNLEGTLTVDAKIRYKSKPTKANISVNNEDNTIIMNLHEKQFAITPGQSAVWYEGDKLVGGGIIQKVM